jgi:uncharacterized RDD family membrane protein YckC
MNQADAQPPVAVAENVTGPRIVAALIDMVLLGMLFILMSIVFGEASASSDDGSSGFSVNLSGAPFLLYLLVSFLYFFLLELHTGHTLGKMIVNIRVVAVDGRRTASKIAIRTLLRIVDGLPFFYLLGLVVVAVSRRNQRIGDMAAGTVVVRA